MKFAETGKRSIIKAITFRILILLGDAVIIYAITRRLDVAISVIFFSNISSTIIYFFHERGWNKISWGKLKKR